MSLPDFSLLFVKWGDLQVNDTLLINEKRTGIQEHRVVSKVREDEDSIVWELRNLFTEETSSYASMKSDAYYKVVAQEGARKLTTEKQIRFNAEDDE